jgi:hypothetical protein
MLDGTLLISVQVLLVLNCYYYFFIFLKKVIINVVADLCSWRHVGVQDPFALFVGTC